ncbi:MAG: DUF7487 domain-containing protein [bacterium]
MILDDKIQIKINKKNINHYTLKGFDNLKINDMIYVKSIDIPIYSRIIVKCKCTNCGLIKDLKLNDYNKSTNNQTSEYYCLNCRSIKTKKTNIKKYGVDNVFKSDVIKDKIRNTNMEKYGVDHHMQNNSILEKMKKTNIEKYGVDFVQKNKNIRKKTEQTSIEKYGNKTSLLNKIIKDKISKTNIERYGFENPIKSIEIKEKSKQTRINNIIKKYESLNILKIDDIFYTIQCDNGKKHNFEITSGLLYHRYNIYKTVVCTICNEINSKSISGLQTQLFNFIKENYNDEILINDRNIIKPHEIDIFLPKLKLGFEFNGLYWHSENIKGKKYHHNKTNKSIENGIELFHIYEDDWNYKQDIIKSMILNKLNITKYKIFARKCEIKEIKDNKIVKNFLNKNHLQGHVNSSIKIGLYYNNELVSLMTFGKLRKPLGSKNIDNSFEMLRFCNKLNTNVVGGASKLFKYFINNYNFDNIISYVNKSHSIGNLYYNLGFEFLKETAPNYYYVIDNIRNYRFNFRKDILVKKGYDKNKTESEIMYDLGYYKIYDSGNLKFIYKNKKGF